MAYEPKQTQQQPVLPSSKPVEAPKVQEQAKTQHAFKLGEMVLTDVKTGEGGLLRVPALIAGIRQVSKGKKDENGEQVYEEKLVKMGKGKEPEEKRFPVMLITDIFDLKLFHPNYADVQTVRDKFAADLHKI